MIILDNFHQLFKYSFFLNGRFDIWPLDFRGKKKSPIGINTENAIGKEATPILFHNYNKKHTAKLENTGQTVNIKPADDINPSTLPKISGSLLPSYYILDNVHFHWDSEHTIDGKRYSMEGHFVHYDAKRQSLENALKYSDGVVVLAVLYDEKISFNDTLKEISKNVKKVAKVKNESVEMKNKINFSNLLPKSTDRFYTYEGTLDWPNASDVKWIVFEEPSNVSTKQLQQITNIYGDKNVRVTTNARTLQNLNGREVVYVHYTTSFAKALNFVEEKVKEYTGIFK